MPGPVSDSYDPEFGTGDNASIVADSIRVVRDRIGRQLGAPLRPIVQVCSEEISSDINIVFTERELRIIRFCLNRALESI